VSLEKVTQEIADLQHLSSLAGSLRVVAETNPKVSFSPASDLKQDFPIGCNRNDWAIELKRR
jgi:hypothetical protein